MYLPTAAQRLGWLAGYWLVNLLFIVVVTLGTQHNVLHMRQSHLGKVLIATFAFGWLVPLPTIAAAWLALGRQAWWRRPLVALGLLLSIEYLSWLLRDKNLEPPYYGDISIFIWLPFGSAAVVWIAMALLGRWRTVLADEPQKSLPPAQFALWEMFVWTVLVALMIWPAQNMANSYARDKSLFLDSIVIFIAAFLSMAVVPPLTLLVAGVLRIALGNGRPSLMICATLAVVILGFVIWGLYAFEQSGKSIEDALVPVGFALGVLAHTCLLGYILRRLGYRIQSRSWWAHPQRTGPVYPN